MWAEGGVVCRVVVIACVFFACFCVWCFVFPPAYYILTSCNVGAFGGRPRWFSGLSGYSQLLVAGGGIVFSSSILELFCAGVDTLFS